MIVGLKPYPAMKDSGVPGIGEVPAHWKTAAVKRHYAIRLGKMLQSRPDASHDVEASYLKAQHVQWFTVRTTNAPKMWASPLDLARYGIAVGDLLVCEGGEGGRSGLVKEIAAGHIIQNALHRVRPLGESRNDFLQYVMSTVAAAGWFDAINSKATIAHFTRERFGALSVSVPPPAEQVAIVRFLDYADRRIKRYIRAKQKLIKLLEEQKQSIVCRAITRGLDPSVRVKPSGVNWLGDVPEHWDVVALRRRWTVTDCKHLTVPFVGDGIPLASVREAQSFELTLDTSNRTTPEWYEQLIQGERRPQVGDVIYCRNVGVGAAALVTRDEVFAMGQDVCLIRSSTENQRWLNYYLHSKPMADQLALILVGSTFSRINVADIKALLVPAPPRCEQDQIVNYLDTEVTRIEVAVHSCQRQQTLLRECRTRLIADVVTGKLDIREAAARLPERPEEQTPLVEDPSLTEESEGALDAITDAVSEEEEA